MTETCPFFYTADESIEKEIDFGANYAIMPRLNVNDYD
jgi:hypothetical protein